MAPEKLENKIHEIEKIVESLQNDELDIDKSIEMYENGIKLIRECETLIGSYEEKIKNLLDGDKKID